MNKKTKKNLHLLHDDKFTNGAIAQFETSYPGENFYVILQSGNGSLVFTEPGEDCLVINLRDRKWEDKIATIVQRYMSANLFVHYIDSYKAAMVRSLLAQFELKLYWIFYGGDLYGFLEEHRGYQLYDRPRDRPSIAFFDRLIKKWKYLFWFGISPNNAIQECFLACDYFCFWNENDFELFTNYFPSKAKFKSFIYYHALGNADFFSNAEKKYIMVNHASSPSGNHLTILKKLKERKLTAIPYTILLPLSYGDSNYAEEVIKAYNNVFPDRLEALRNFLPLHAYQQRLSEISSAIFGMRRQEAAGNIFQLLNLGARVFLREENSLLKWLLDRKFIVFSLENDLRSVDDLKPLSVEEVAYNRARYQLYFNAIVYKNMMDQLLEE
ncbi:TDP-N-acetylfucosamine:lipid II N-acetylfucosaminyltransferase [Sphingobacterium suaedae]|uniref:TDP-N-acetylfucosamine:lipid II N-acetylfucosaminyltransferase n=1 Tax=Sphingobacterium suaedae TaxID=1686402 RepID=A0ABW5KN20_9SPHI